MTFVRSSATTGASPMIFSAAADTKLGLSLNLSSYHSLFRLLSSRLNSSSRSFADMIAVGLDPSRFIVPAEVTGRMGLLSRGNSRPRIAGVISSKSKPARPGDGTASTPRSRATIEGLVKVEEAAVDTVGTSES